MTHRGKARCQETKRPKTAGGRDTQACAYHDAARTIQPHLAIASCAGHDTAQQHVDQTPLQDACTDSTYSHNTVLRLAAQSRPDRFTSLRYP